MANPKMYGAKRTKSSIAYCIDNERIKTTNLQMEIDLTIELDGRVTVFEGKNNFPKNFAVYQLYLPFLYYHNLKTENKLHIIDINCCYLLRSIKEDGSVIRIYNYTFDNPFNLTSIRLIKSIQYNLLKR